LFLQFREQVRAVLAADDDDAFELRGDGVGLGYGSLSEKEQGGGGKDHGREFIKRKWKV
jgi:hypothetical protein